MKLDIANLIRIYDTGTDEGIQSHISAITGVIGEDIAVGLLKDYFKRKGAKMAQSLPEKPRELVKSGTNKNKGKRLDAWIVVQSKEYILYQTEIKNWSAHSLAGYRRAKLSLDCGIDHLVEFSNTKFHNQWDIKKAKFRSALNSKNYESKVLLKMETPNLNGIDKTVYRIEPLICYWYPIAPKESFTPFYSIKTKEEHFSLVNFFSMSLYLREIYSDGIRSIDIDVPNVGKRFKCLVDIFPSTKKRSTKNPISVNGLY